MHINRFFLFTSTVNNAFLKIHLVKGIKKNRMTVIMTDDRHITIERYHNIRKIRKYRIVFVRRGAIIRIILIFLIVDNAKIYCNREFESAITLKHKTV